MAKRGRPTQYTEELGDKIASYLAIGLTLKEAAEYAGLDPKMVQKWKERNKDFVAKCSRAELAMKAMAGRNEYRMLEAEDPKATQSFKNREEAKRHHRAMERIRRLEAKARAKETGTTFIPAVLDVRDVLREIDEAFTEDDEKTSEEDDDGVPQP